MSINERIDQMRDDIIDSTKELVKIKSLEGPAVEGMPFGEGPGKALEKALEIAESLGFKTVNLDGYVGYAEYGEGEEYVAALGHLDVVPEGDGWDTPPYEPTIRDGKLYGRGTIDNKGPIVATLYGLKAIVDEGIKLDKKVRVIFGTNEETGSKELPYYNKREKPPVAGFTPDADFPIINGEKGLTRVTIAKQLDKEYAGISLKSIAGGQAPNVVPEHCEFVITAEDTNAAVEAMNAFGKANDYKINTKVEGNEITVTTAGVSAHGSTPQDGLNAIMIAFGALGTLNIEDESLKSYVDFMNENIGMDYNGEKLGCGLEDEESHKLTFNVGVISMVDGKVSIIVDARYPVTYKLEDFETPLRARFEGTGIDIEKIGNTNPLYFEKSHPLIKTLLNVYKEQTGREAYTTCIGGGTYAKGMPNIVAFGPRFPEDPVVIHKPNEYIKVEDLITSAKIYANALYELAK